MSLNIKELTINLLSGETVVDNISFHIGRGEMLAIVGGSGAGKSTICKSIMGLLGNTYQVEGEIEFKGKNLVTLPQKEKRTIYGKDMCYIMQNPMTAFNPSIRIGTQLSRTYQLHHSNCCKADIHVLIKETMEKLGLKDTERILKSYPYALSGGMLQRLMITAALINEPQVLIADEATTAIDSCNRMELMKELRSLCNSGMSILFVTHDLRTAAYAEKILIMNRGRVVEKGNTQDILENPKEEYTRYLLNACHIERRGKND